MGCMARLALLCLLLILVAAAAFMPTPRFEEQTRLDPLLAYPGTDTTAMHRSIENLAHAARIIASYYTEDERMLIESVLVPRVSLHALAELEDARRALLDTPRLYAAIGYLVRMERAITALEDDASRLEDALRARERPVTFVFAEGYASTVSIADGLSAFRTALADARAESRRRIGCIIGMCAIAYPASFATVPRLTRESTDEDTAARRVYATIHDALDAHVDDVQQSVRMRSVCAGEPESLLLASTHTSHTGAPARRIMSLDDITMYDYTPQSLEKRARSGITHDPGITALFAAHGIDYTYQPEGNFYFCLEAGRDALTTGRILGLAAALSDMRADSALPDIPRKLVDSFLDAPYLDEHAASLIVVALEERAMRGLATATELELLVLARAGTYRYEDVLESAVQMHEFQIGLLEEIGETPPVVGALVMRSFPSVVFPLYALPDIPSLISVANDSARSSGDSTSYLTLRETIPTEELDAALIRYARFMNENRERVRQIAERVP